MSGKYCKSGYKQQTWHSCTSQNSYSFWIWSASEKLCVAMETRLHSNRGVKSTNLIFSLFFFKLWILKSGLTTFTLTNAIFLDILVWLLCKPLSMATQDISDADHIQNWPGSPWQLPWQPPFFYQDLQFSHENQLNFLGLKWDNLSNSTCIKRLAFKIFSGLYLTYLGRPFKVNNCWVNFGHQKRFKQNKTQPCVIMKIRGIHVDCFWYQDGKNTTIFPNSSWIDIATFKRTSRGNLPTWRILSIKVYYIGQSQPLTHGPVG